MMFMKHTTDQAVIDMNNMITMYKYARIQSRNIQTPHI